MKANFTKAKSLNQVQKTIKIALYVLNKHFGFWKKRLALFLNEWARLVHEINTNDDMLELDQALEKIIPRDILRAIGMEHIKDDTGRRLR